MQVRIATGPHLPEWISQLRTTIGPAQCRVVADRSVDGATFTIPTQALSPVLRQRLRLQPKTAGRPKKNAASSTTFFNAWTVATSGAVRIPRVVGRCLFGMARRSIVSDGSPLGEEVVFNGRLAPFQAEATTIVERHLRTSAEQAAMLVADCGCGKTVMALHLVAALGRRALVLVHTTTLAEQWEERARSFLPDCRVARIGGGTNALPDDFDVAVAMIQTVARGADTSSCGTVVIDECHHVAAPFFSKVLACAPGRYRLGLSATPDRTDGLGPALSFLVGPTVATVRRPPSSAPLQVVHVHTDSSSVPVPRDRHGDVIYGTLITRVAAREVRTTGIAHVVAAAFARGRKVLVLSDRRDQLAAIQDTAADRFGVPRRHRHFLGVTGKRRRDDRDVRVRTSGSYSHPTAWPQKSGYRRTLRANTCDPRKSPATIRQVVGRLHRSQGDTDGHEDSVVVDVVDYGIPTLENMAKVRKSALATPTTSRHVVHQSFASVTFA